MTARTDTKDRILASADRLLRSHGFNGFSYQDIARPLGIRNAAVHYHFATKADLTVAVVESVRKLLHDRTEHFMAHGGDARLQMEGFLVFSIRECAADGCVCPVGALAADFFALPEPVQAAARRLVDDLVTWMTRVCTLGSEQGSFRFEGDPADKAREILAALQGARQLSRVLGPSAIEAVAEQLRRDLGIAGV